MKKLPALLYLIALSQPIFAEDAGTTRGIIDIRKPERPADATILVGDDGYNLVPEWKDKPMNWVFEKGVLTASPQWDSLLTKDDYQDFRMHVEFNVNDSGGAKDEEGNGNSGVYIQQRYEVQIHNSFGIEDEHFKPSFGGSIYKIKKPDKLVAKPAGEWQTYDIAFRNEAGLCTYWQMKTQ